jgi:hypothetical protein
MSIQEFTKGNRVVVRFIFRAIKQGYVAFLFGLYNWNVMPHMPEALPQQEL